jgi:hypothetical protein
MLAMMAFAGANSDATSRKQYKSTLTKLVNSIRAYQNE